MAFAIMTPGAPAKVQAQVFGALKNADTIDEQSVIAQEQGQYGAEMAVPRYFPAKWLNFAEHSTRMMSCGKVIARAAVGLGVRAIVDPEVEQELTKEGNRNKLIGIGRTAKRYANLLRQPNTSRDPTTSVCYKAELDHQLCGNGFIECAEDRRRAGNLVVGLRHVPAANIRVRKDGLAFVRNIAGRRIFFRVLGDTHPKRKYMDALTGRFYGVWPSDIPESRMATALLHLKNYCPLDDFYGMPPAAPAWLAIMMNSKIGEWNMNFILNNAYIPIAVVVKNGTLHPDSVEQVSLFSGAEGKGIQNVGRVMLLQPDMSNVMAGANNVDISVHDLKMGITDDGSWLKLRDMDNLEIQEAFGVADVMLGGSASTRATAREGRGVTQENVIEPRTVFWEYQLDNGVAAGYGESVRTRFQRPSNLDLIQRANVATKFLKALTYDEARAEAAKLLQNANIQPLGQEFTGVPTGVLETLIKGRQLKQIPLPEAA